jgi:RNA polymerase sigma-70 factor (ECF subfamily)
LGEAGGSVLSPAEWFAEEVQPHEPMLRSWLRARFSALRDVDDVVQESFLKVWRARAAGKIDHPRAYLFTIARNAALDRVRRERVIPFERLTESESSFVVEDRADVSSTLDAEAELDLLAEAVRTLPDRCREVLVLRKYHGLSHGEIAARLGITRNTVNAQITIAMVRVREYFRSRGRLPKERHAG